MILLDGKKVRDCLVETLRRKVGAFSTIPRLAIVQVGDKKESSAYIRQKKVFGERIGVAVRHIPFPLSVSELEIIKEIERLNENRDIHGIILQLPLPASLDKQKLLDSIAPIKDVDGLGGENAGLLARGTPYLWPATARGILELLTFYAVTVDGKKVAVVGRSSLVGQPTAELLRAKGASVTVCHSETSNTKDITRTSDIIVVAIGKPEFITADYFRQDNTQTVVDVGITAVSKEGLLRLEEEIAYRPSGGTRSTTLLGDVAFEEVKERIYAISPVPGGVGPMTVSALFENLVEAYERQVRHT